MFPEWVLINGKHSVNNYHLGKPWEAGEEGRGFRDCVPLLQFLRPIALLVAVWVAISISQSPG